jgi:2C-methyl-D-erythritol 2,4-cyclodiphosphate synthase
LNVSASANSNTKINAKENDNNLSKNASLNNEATLSSAQIKKTGNQLNDEQKGVITTQTNAIVKNSNHVETNVNKTIIKTDKKINAVSTTAIQSGVAAAHAIKPSPASIKMKTQVKTNTGIRIR